MKTLIEYKYHVLCFILFASLTTNILLYQENRVYERAVLRAMDIIGIPEDPNAKWDKKMHLEMFLQHLEEMPWYMIDWDNYEY